MSVFAAQAGLWIIGLAFSALAPAPAQGQTGSPPGEYRQSAAILARYPDVPVAMDAPGLPRRDGFTSHDEMLAHLERLKARAPHLHRGTLGQSQMGREIPYLIFTAEGLADTGRIKALDRPIVWLIGQQHGDEPAGGEAMLALASALADGELKLLLDRITVVIVPRVNPDGAARFTRAAANGRDPNRDHLLLTLPETRALHAKLAELPADLVVDAHEFQVAGPWLTRFRALQKSDAMLLQTTHPAVPKESAAYAKTAFIPAIGAVLESVGLTHVLYHTLTDEAGAGAVSLGGNAPGTSRNALGLAGAVSLLVETRGIGIGRQGFQRRVATHYLAAKAVLEKAAAEPEQLRRIVAGARQAIAGARDPLILGYRAETVKWTIPLIDPRTGADRPTKVDFTDTLRVRVTGTRPRPAGYLVQPEAKAAIEALKVRGVRLCAVESRPLQVEAFRVRAKAAPVNRESINPGQAITVALGTKTVTPAHGAVLVPLAQPAAALIAASLEPDSPGSHSAARHVPMAKSGEAPVYRFPAAAPLPRCAP